MLRERPHLWIYSTIHIFLAGHELEKFNNSVTAETFEVAPETIINVQQDTSGIDAGTDGANVSKGFLFYPCLFLSQI